MHKVKDPGPGREDVFSCMGLIRTGDAVKGNDADLHVMVLFLLGEILQISGSLLLQVVPVYCNCDKTTWPIFKILVPSASSVSSASNYGVWRLYLYSKVAFDLLAATMYQYFMLYLYVVCIFILYLYIYCISIIFHVTSYAVPWIITLRQLLNFSYFILSSGYTMKCSLW